MIPTDPRNRLHNQHLPTSSVQTTRCVKNHKTRGVNFDADYPNRGSIFHAEQHSELDQPAKVAASEGYEGYGVPMAVDR